MLKLEKASREGLISIIIRDKERLVTKPLAIAFGVAFAIHLGLICLFQVVPITIDTQQIVFSPIRAEAESQTRESAVADIKIMAPSIRGLPSMPLSLPLYPSDPQFLMSHPLEYAKTDASLPLNFYQAEASIYEPAFQPLVKNAPKPFRVIISGILAEQPLLTEGWQEQIPPHTLEPTYVVYSVMAEGKTGRIFWFEPEQYPGNLVASFAESILQQMRFDIDPNIAIVTGQIELYLNSEGS